MDDPTPPDAYHITESVENRGSPIIGKRGETQIFTTEKVVVETGEIGFLSRPGPLALFTQLADDERRYRYASRNFSRPSQNG